MVVDARRILANQELAHLVHGGFHGAGPAFDHRFAPAGETLIGFDFHEHPAWRDAVSSQLRNFQAACFLELSVKDATRLRVTAGVWRPVAAGSPLHGKSACPLYHTKSDTYIRRLIILI